MNKILIKISGMLVLVHIVTFCLLNIARGLDTVKIQGVLMNMNLKQNMMVVNETVFVWNQNTVFNNDKGSPITIDQFKPKAWVYIEGLKSKNSIMIEKIYLLPKYVDKKEKHLYHYMD